MRRASRPLRRQSHLANGTIMNRAKYSLDMMLLRHLNPIFKCEGNYTSNVLNMVDDLYNESKALVEESIDELRRNYTYLTEVEARTLLWHFDGNVYSCIERLDQTSINSARASRRRSTMTSVNNSDEVQVQRFFPNEFTCSICFDDQETETSGALSCGDSGE